MSKRAERRHDRQMARIEARSNKQEMKYDYFKTAAENGIDPRASMWDGISSLGQSAGGTLTSMFGFGNSPGSNAQTGTNPMGSMGFFFLALMAILFLKK
jgi:hypothetical protein